MQRPPRASNAKVIPRSLGIRLGFYGLLVAAGCLAVVAYAEDEYGLAVATTMGLTTMSLLHIAAALEVRDPVHSVFNRATIANGRFNMLILASMALTFLVTSLNPLRRLFDTVDLTGDQWRICILAPIGYVVVAELTKIILRRVGKEDI
jgi:Ca2+-transporting ATPase